MIDIYLSTVVVILVICLVPLVLVTNVLIFSKCILAGALFLIFISIPIILIVPEIVRDVLE